MHLMKNSRRQSTAKTSNVASVSTILGRDRNALRMLPGEGDWEAEGRKGEGEKPECMGACQAVCLCTNPSSCGHTPKAQEEFQGGHDSILCQGSAKNRRTFRRSSSSFVLLFSNPVRIQYEHHTTHQPHVAVLG